MFDSFSARNEELGLQAVRQLRETNKDAGEKIQFHQLDITNVESIHRLAEHIKKNHDGLDILINNAAMAFKVILKRILACFPTIRRNI